jgi:membrane-associated phospholipid phosphatase
MTQLVKGVVLVCCLLGFAGFSNLCDARPQNQQARAAPEQDAGATVSSTADVEASKSITSADPALHLDDRDYRLGRHMLTNFAQDQKAIWTAPGRLRFADANWLVPVSGFTAGLLVTDRDVTAHLSADPKTISHYKNLSNAGVAALVGGAGGLWLLSHAAHNDHWRETGFLAGEAAVNSLVAVEAMKYSLQRQRPFQGDGSGAFFQGGTSFPSEHAAAAWSVAGVIAHEYPGPLSKIMAYGLASLVSYSRVRSRQHFPSDVFVGSLLGEMIAQNVYSRHHDPELGGEAWKSIREFSRGDGTPANQGSPYVPLDSWIYPAMERLASLGGLDEEFMGMRPWTRGECARLVSGAAGELADTGSANRETSGLIEALQREFRSEIEGTTGQDRAAFRLESLYSRTEHISGMPLTDGYTFAQTQFNDFGRPYGQGWSTVNGFSTYATQGRWVMYVRGELQTAPSIPALSLSTREFVQRVDGYPQLPPGTAQPAVNHFSLLDAYVGLAWSNWQLSFGRQSLWWGPGEGGPLMFSDNTQPVNMFRVNRVSPLQLPSILKFLGPLRMEFFIGQVSGHRFVATPTGATGSWSQLLDPQPFIHGEKLSLRPTRNLELGLSRTTIFAGQGIPFTTHTFLRSLFNVGHFTGAGGDSTYPGDRLSGLDFSYRIPKLRNWLTIYGNGYANDQIIFLPTGYPERAIWVAGFYLSRFPRVSKLDLRLEGGYTDNPLGGYLAQGYYYGNLRYLNGYTSDGNVLGSWIGRGGQSEQVWTNYWFSAHNRLQLNFRHQKISQQFIPGGGSLTDVGVRGDFWLRPNLNFSVSVQHERWLFPVIQTNAERNVAATVQIVFQPQNLFQRSVTNENTMNSGNGGRP